MTFLDKFEQQIRRRDESASHALIEAGLSKSLYGKWKKHPERMPYGDTVQKLAAYFGCSVEELMPDVKKQSTTYTRIMDCVSSLKPKDQEKILSYILFTYKEELQDEMQEMPTGY